MEYVGLPRRDKPCERCGWRYVGFHVCFDASKPCPGEGSLDPTSKKVIKKTAPKRVNVSKTLTERWEAHRAQFRERDAAIVSGYEEGFALRELADQFGISHSTVIKAIRRAEVETGKTIMRPRGTNVRWIRQKEVHGGFQ